MEENKEFGTIDPRKQAFDNFKLAALASFETELDALIGDWENEDEISISFHIDVGNGLYDLRQSVKRSSSRELSIRNPKTSKDLEPVSEKEGE